MKPDCIIAWAYHVDFPLWRHQLKSIRDKFNKVIVVFTVTNRKENYANFIQDAMKDENVTFLDNDPVAGDDDWRNVAIHKALKFSNSDWVFFTEQDFFIKNPDFWKVLDFADKSQVLGVYQDTRLHPCCILISKENLEKTSKNFGVVRDRLDHFGLFQEELEKAGVSITKIDERLYHHLNGCGQNMTMLADGMVPNYNPPEFKQYLKDCLECGVELHKDFISLAKAYIK